MRYSSNASGPPSEGGKGREGGRGRTDRRGWDGEVFRLDIFFHLHPVLVLARGPLVLVQILLVGPQVLVLVLVLVLAR